MKALRPHIPVSAWSQCPTVSAAHGDISTTAPPCSAMLRVAATSHRHFQVTRRIHRLHAITARVIVMSDVRAIGSCLRAGLVQQNSRTVMNYSGGASERGVNSDILARLRVMVASPTVATANGPDSI